MKLWEVEFLDFAKTMWFDNCVERHDWQEDPVDFDKYVEVNKEWLKLKHAEKKLNQMRAGI